MGAAAPFGNLPLEDEGPRIAGARMEILLRLKPNRRPFRQKKTVSTISGMSLKIRFFRRIRG